MVLLSNTLLILFLIAVCVTDLRSRRIPNALTLAMAACWIVLAMLELGTGQTTMAAAGLRFAEAIGLGGILLAFTFVFERATHSFAMGGGDIKLIACITLYVGFDVGCIVLLIACLLAVLVSAFHRVAPHRCRFLPRGAVDNSGEFSTEIMARSVAGAFPFVPFLACSALFVLFGIK